MNATSRVLWILGEPGVGKTTLVRRLVEGLQLSLVAKPKWTLAGDSFALAGHYTGGTFDGADTVPYNGVSEAMDYWRREILGKVPVTILDGDRFSHDSARQIFAAEARVLGVLLSAPTEISLLRRNLRGSTQNPSWVAGRKTKALRFFEGFKDSDSMELDARLPSEDLVSRLREFLTGEKKQPPLSSILDMF